MKKDFYKESVKLHKTYKGKIKITTKCPIKSYEDFALLYTPGVAQPCIEIQKDISKVYDYTNKGNLIAIVTDGTRVLGLGDIGPEASLPVMEGKSLLFKYLGGVDAIPIALDTKDPEKFIETIKLLQPSFGGFNLEDISHPKCFYILERLRKELKVPVWHDDQQGTAVVILAGLINALKIVKKDYRKVKVGVIGSGAAGIAAVRLMVAYGFDAGNIVVCDTKGIIHKEREDFEERFKYTKDVLVNTNKEGRKSSSEDAIPKTMEGMDIVIAVSKPGPSVIKKEWIKLMNDQAIIFPCANPVPEILPKDAKKGGARIVATGRSDFPNQVNNSLAFPAIFRGVLEVGATTITDEMCIAAAESLAKYAQDKGLNEDYIIPTMDDWEVFPLEATAVGLKAQEQGVARKKFSKNELYKKVYETIKCAREEIKFFSTKYNQSKIIK
jgi:malate dehydrogenase (oxaloacetate-decarboxylating)